MFVVSLLCYGYKPITRGDLLEGEYYAAMSFADIDRSSKQLTSVLYNGANAINLDRAIAGKDMQDKCPNDFDGIFSQDIVKEFYIHPLNNGGSRSFFDGSKVSNMIENSDQYKELVTKILDDADENNQSFISEKRFHGNNSISFRGWSFDLAYSIGWTNDTWITARKLDNGGWSVDVTIKDKYDFNEKGFSEGVVKGLVNDYAG